MCFRHNVVYSVKCEICQEFYIGQTTRHFHERAIEHMRAARNPTSYKMFAISSHYLRHHNTVTPHLSFHILQQCNSGLDCKIAEAHHILRENPTINNKREADLCIAQLLID
jgi:hypothetical protein